MLSCGLVLTRAEEPRTEERRRVLKSAEERVLKSTQRTQHPQRTLRYSAVLSVLWDSGRPWGAGLRETVEKSEEFPEVLGSL